jgi:hypothetical protein
MNALTFATVLARGRTSGQLAGLMGVALLVSACDGRTQSPTSPTPTATTPPTTATFNLSGAVSEMTTAGPAPIGGARVAVTSSGRAAVTDASGHYSIPGLSATSHLISVTRDGYVTQTRTVTLSGDTQLDVRLEREEGYILSGVVFEMTAAGPVPIESVEIYCDSCGSPTGHTSVHTDANGYYSLAWAKNGHHPLLVRKVGYGVLDSTDTVGDGYGRITATVRGDTRFDIQLVKR